MAERRHWWGPERARLGRACVRAGCGLRARTVRRSGRRSAMKRRVAVTEFSTDGGTTWFESRVTPSCVAHAFNPHAQHVEMGAGTP